MKIAVASGKGGTGKTFIATNLAALLAEQMQVTLVDADVEEPNAGLFLGPKITGELQVDLPVPALDADSCTGCGQCAAACRYGALAMVGNHPLILDHLCHGCGACTYICPSGALFEVGRRIGVVRMGSARQLRFIEGRLDPGQALAPPLVRATRARAAEEDGLVIIDAPPGTSCPVVAAVTGVDYVVLVTEPTPFGWNDLSLAAGMLRQLGLPLGVVINRWGMGGYPVEEQCRRTGLLVLLRLPWDRQVAVTYARGQLSIDDSPHWRRALGELYKAVVREVRP
ncbi:MAG: ATP-binding protein [Bacillota bacterium]